MVDAGDVYTYDWDILGPYNGCVKYGAPTSTGPVAGPGSVPSSQGCAIPRRNQGVPRKKHLWNGLSLGLEMGHNG